MSRFSKFPGARAQRTGPDAYVGQRESEDLRRLLPNQTEWILGSANAYEQYELLGSTLVSGIGTVRFMPLQVNPVEIKISRVCGSYNTAEGEVALYYYSDSKLKLLPGTQATFAASGSYTTVIEEALPRTITIPVGTRLFFAFRQTTTGTAVILRHAGYNTARPQHLRATATEMQKEFTRSELAALEAANLAFPDFAFYSTEYANLL